MKYIECQFQLAIARSQWWHALIVSGAYKARKLQRGTDERSPDGCIVFRDCTDEEKLEDAMATMNRHIQMAQEVADAIYETTEATS